MQTSRSESTELHRHDFSGKLLEACLKCQFEDMECKYVGGPDEHLDVTCTGCGYHFVMACASDKGRPPQ
jgi:hypothetical protein